MPNTLVKIPIVLRVDWTWLSRSILLLKKQNLPHFELVYAITRHRLKLRFPNLNQKCIIALLRSLLILGLIDLALQIHFQILSLFFYQIYLRCLSKNLVRPLTLIYIFSARDLVRPSPATNQICFGSHCLLLTFSFATNYRWTFDERYCNRCIHIGSPVLSENHSGVSVLTIPSIYLGCVRTDARMRDTSFKLCPWPLGSGYQNHYTDVTMIPMASQITSLTIVYSTVYSGTNQRKHRSSASLAFVRGIHRWPVNSPHNGPVTRKIFPFDDVIMDWSCAGNSKAKHGIATGYRWTAMGNTA